MGDVEEPMVASSTEETSTAQAILEVEEQMSVLVRHVRASMQQAATAIDPALPPFGLKVLRQLARCGPTHASVVAEQLGVDRSVISRQARQLEDLGLIRMHADATDGRARFLSLTPVAVERMDMVGASGKSLITDALSGWSAEDLRQFAAYIARLNSQEF